MSREKQSIQSEFSSSATLHLDVNGARDVTRRHIVYEIKPQQFR